MHDQTPLVAITLNNKSMNIFMTSSTNNNISGLFPFYKGLVGMIYIPQRLLRE